MSESKPKLGTEVALESACPYCDGHGRCKCEGSGLVYSDDETELVSCDGCISDLRGTCVYCEGYGKYNPDYKKTWLWWRKRMNDHGRAIWRAKKGISGMDR